jgi:predicted transcriptional regulator
MDHTLELVSMNLRAIAMLPEDRRKSAIDRLATILERQDEDLETELLALGGIMQRHITENGTHQGATSVEDERRRFIQEIEAGLEDAAAGRVMSTQELKDWFKRKRGLHL